MFNQPKALLVVYKEKDEIALNQLKKLVDTKDDVDGNQVGVKDGTMSIISWDEKTWLHNKKVGNTGDIADKVLFIGNIKGTEKLLPVVDIKFDKHGVSYGFAGNQALMQINAKELADRKSYEDFLTELGTITDIAIAKQDKKMKPGDVKQLGKVTAVGALATIGGFLMNPLIAGVASGILYKDLFGDAKLVREQMLIYGVTQLYLNDLDSFMKA